MSLPEIDFRELDGSLKNQIHLRAIKRPDLMDQFLLIFTNKYYPISKILETLSQAEFPLNDYLKELRIKVYNKVSYSYQDPYTKTQYTLNYEILDDLIKKINNLLI